MIDALEFVKATLLIASNQRLTRAEFEQRQLKRFREFAAFVMDHSRYYRRVMKEHGIDPATCTPQQFPVLLKTDVLGNFDDIVTSPEITSRGVELFLHGSHDPNERYLGRYTVIHTSGTSGQVGLFVFDPKAWARGLAQVANTPSFGFLPRRRKVAFLGPTDGHYAGISMTGSAKLWPMNLLYRGMYFEINKPLATAIEGLNKFQPDILVSYGHTLTVLAEKQMEGVLNIHPRQITNSAEPLPPYRREAIEKAFGPVLRNLYSCSEHLCIGIREANSDSMRLIEDDLIIELFDDHMLVTNMFNRVMPLIRYRMNDVMRPVPSTAHGPYRTTAEAVGRAEEMAKFTNRHGVVDGISPYTILELLIPGVRSFQLRITGAASCTLVIVLDPDATLQARSTAITAAEARLKAILAQKEMDNVAFTIAVAQEIPIDPRTRKFKLIVNDNSAQGSGA